MAVKYNIITLQFTNPEMLTRRAVGGTHSFLGRENKSDFACGLGAVGDGNKRDQVGDGGREYSEHQLD